MVHRKGHVWTASKLEFLEKYLPVFTKIIGRNFPKKLYVDGYAGPGTNTIGGEIKLGSPLLAINALPAFDELYLVEKKRSLVQQLVQNIADLNLPQERQAQLHVRQGDFNAEVDNILTALSSATPVFFFLDPEGLELDWETVRKIGRRRRADLFILISAGGVSRCAGYALTHDSVTRFYGHERWRPIAEGVDPNHIIGQSKFEAFVELYLEGLRGLGFAHVKQFLIATNSQNSQLHALVFAAKNDTAIKIAEDILQRMEKARLKKDKGAEPLF